MRKYLPLAIITRSLAALVIATSTISYAQKLVASADNRLIVKISKSGLNRISNLPYQIVQVTGDDSTYRLKSDADGQNIYLMPLKAIGEKIEISIKNNIGQVQDLELQVANIKGQSIDINSKSVLLQTQRYQQQELKGMLAAMAADLPGKYYAQKVDHKLGNLGSLDVRQTGLYKWQDLVGGVFIIKNRTRYPQSIKQEDFIKRFDHVLASFVGNNNLAPKESARFLVIQKLSN